MHIVGAFSSFDVSFRHLDRFTSGGLPILFRKLSDSLPTAVRVLSLAAQGLMFATAMWLLLAAPGFLSAQDGVRMEPAHQASR